MPATGVPWASRPWGAPTGAPPAFRADTAFSYAAGLTLPTVSRAFVTQHAGHDTPANAIRACGAPTGPRWHARRRVSPDVRHRGATALVSKSDSRARSRHMLQRSGRTGRGVHAGVGRHAGSRASARRSRRGADAGERREPVEVCIRATGEPSAGATRRLVEPCLPRSWGASRGRSSHHRHVYRGEPRARGAGATAGGLSMVGHRTGAGPAVGRVEPSHAARPRPWSGDAWRCPAGTGRGGSRPWGAPTGCG